MPCSVSTSRSSNRTGGFPASGSRTRLMVSPTSSDEEVSGCSAIQAHAPDCCQDVGDTLAHPVRTSDAATDATEPGPRGLPVAVAAAVVIGFPCFMCIPSIHAVVSTPAELQSAFVAGFLCNAGLPRLTVRSASTLNVSRPRRAFTCVTACIFAGSPSDPFHRRLRRIRCLLRRLDCYWASDPSQAGLPPAKIHTHSRRTVRTI